MTEAGPLTETAPRPAPPPPPWRDRAARAAAGRAPLLAAAFGAALPAWILSRLATLLAVRLAGPRRWALPTGERVHDFGWFFCWDGAWYRQIAEYGYEPAGTQGVRFFPLLPLTDRFLSAVTGVPIPVVQALVTGGCALGLGMALHLLVLHETGDAVKARRAAWLVQLVPGAFVLTLGYSEAPAGFLGVLFFLAVRRSRFPLGIVTGFLGGLARPTGVLLVLPGLVEAYRTLRSGAGPRRVAMALAAAASPAAGLGAYLLWVGHVYGDPMLPSEVAKRPELRGALINNPLPYLFKTVPAGFDWQFQVIVIVAALAMGWVVVRRLPFAYTVWTLPMMGSALTAQYFWSAPRYLGEVFTLSMAAALVTVDRRAFAWAVCACLPLVYYLSFLAFTERIAP